MNVKLYRFLKKNETRLYRGINEVVAVVYIDFCDINEFIKIVGESYFNDSVEVLLYSNNIVVELNNIIEYFGQEIADYRTCFDKDEFSLYFNGGGMKADER